MPPTTNEITEQVIGCVFAVANILGPRFLEKVYENAQAHELRKAQLTAEQQAPVRVFHDSVLVGEFFADILVKKQVVVELKCTEKITNLHAAQCLNYLRATGLRTGLLISFATPRIGIRRFSL